MNPRFPIPSDPATMGQVLLIQQAQQILALSEQCKTLAAMVAGKAAGGGGRGTKKKDPEKARLRGLTVEQYAVEHYLPGKNHSPTSATAEITHNLIGKMDACFGRKMLLKEVKDSLIESFRNWFSSCVASDRLAPATANKYLRQLRSIYNYAAKKKILRPLAPIDFLAEPEPDVNAWTSEDLFAIESQARKQTGLVGGVAAATFWTAWALLFQKIGCRVTAMMLSRRDDYDPITRALLLRRENQKQKRDQRIALPPRAAEAIERLLAAHDHQRIFGCWPYDPPVKATGRRKWKVLAAHFERLLVQPAGLTLQKGVKTRQFRRTAATICEENGGNAQELLGHADRKTTERYKDRKRRPICRQSLFVADGRTPQKMLF